MENDFKIGELVKDAEVIKVTPIGVRVDLDGYNEGLLYYNDNPKRFQKGELIDVYIKRIHQNGNIDLSLEKTGFRDKLDASATKILGKLKQNKGFLPYNDRSRPEIITQEFGMSKKQFKQAIGNLYKRRLILIEPKGIKLSENSKSQNR